MSPKIHHCMGGLYTNEKAQVYHVQGHLIPGLYAAGEAAGGVHGAVRLAQIGQIRKDLRIFAVENVAVGAVFQRFHQGDIKAVAAVGISKDIVAATVDRGLSLVHQEFCSFRNVRIERIVRRKDERSGDIFASHFKTAIAEVVDRNVFFARLTPETR